MPLKKTIAAHRDQSGAWIEQRDIEVGPLEEAAILADWAAGEHQRAMPRKMTVDEKIDVLVNPEKGAAEVLSKNNQYTENFRAWEIQNNALEKERQDKWKEFQDKLATLPPETMTC